MSLVLENAFLFRDPDLGALDRFLQDWRLKLREEGQAGNAALYARKAAEIIDGQATSDLRLKEKLPAIPTPLSHVSEKIQKARNDARAGKFIEPEMDFGFEITLHEHEGHLYGNVFSTQQDWVASFLEDPAISHAPFWDNTDRPGDVSEDEWERRRQAWKAILSRDTLSRPSHCGLMATLTPCLFNPVVDDVVAAQPDLEERVRNCARETLSYDYFHQVDFQDDAAKFMAHYGRFSTFLRRQYGKDMLRAYEDACRERMTPWLESADFLGGSFSVPRELPPIS